MKINPFLIILIITMCIYAPGAIIMDINTSEEPVECECTYECYNDGYQDGYAKGWLDVLDSITNKIENR